MSRKKPPDCGAAARDAPLAHRGNDLVQRQIWLPGNQCQQRFRVFLQRRPAPSGGLCSGASGVTPSLQPLHCGAWTQIEALGGFPPRRSRFDCFNHAFPQIIRIRLRHCLDPQRTNQCSQTRPPTRSWESLRFNSAGKCSSFAFCDGCSAGVFSRAGSSHPGRATCFRNDCQQCCARPCDARIFGDVYAHLYSGRDYHWMGFYNSRPLTRSAGQRRDPWRGNLVELDHGVGGLAARALNWLPLHRRDFEMFSGG